MTYRTIVIIKVKMYTLLVLSVVCFLFVDSVVNALLFIPRFVTNKDSLKIDLFFYFLFATTKIKEFEGRVTEEDFAQALRSLLIFG